MRKKLTSMLLVLCFVLTLLPATALAATPAPVFVGGANVVNPINTILYYTSDGDGGITNSGAHSGNYVVKYDPYGTTPTLTLKGANITKALTTNAGYANETKYGIYTNGDLNIVLADGTTNTIAGADSNAFSYGVCVVTGGLGGGSLTISGNGTLNVSGGSINSSGSDTANYGLCVSKNLTISSGTINASCPNDNAYAKYSFGINAYGTITVSGGTVTASGGVAGTNYGMASTNNITISGGTVNVSCPPANYTSYSIKADNTLTVSGGTVTVFANNTTVNYGLFGSEQLVFSGGTVTAAGKTEAIATAPGTTIFSGSFAEEGCFVKADPNVNGTDTAVITSRAPSIFSGNPGYKYVTISPILHAVTPTITNNLSTSEVKYTLNGTADPLNATATVTDGGTVTYDWYSNTTNTTEGGTRLDMDTAVYTPSTAAAGTAYYYCVVTNTIEDNGDGGTKTKTATSAVAHITVKNASPIAPSCHFSFDGDNACKLMGATAAMEYSLNGGVSYTGCSADILLTAADITVNKGIKVRFRETDDTYVGPTLTFYITKAATPALTPTQPDTIGGSGIIPMTNIHEYSSDDGNTWTAAEGDTTLAAATYLVRVKARGTSMASNTQSITLTAYTGIPETTPAALVNYIDEKLTNLTANGSYAVNGTDVSADSTGNLAIGNSWFGTTISLVKKGDGITTNDSAEQSITLAPRPTTPDCTATQPSASSATGTITGVTAAMQYSIDNGTNWTDGTDTDVTGLNPGSVLIRVKATESAPASLNQTMMITAYTAPLPYTPTAPVTKIDNGGHTTSSNLEKLVSESKPLTVDGDNGAKLVFEPDALKGIAGQTSGDIKVEMKDVSPVHQENLPRKQVFSLTVSSGSGAITNFGGSVTVSLPYELNAGETAEEVTVWYLSGDGTMTELPCTYDPATGLATFKVTHFSLYVVGTESWVNPFTDVSENDWFYDAVRYVSRSDLMQGTGTTFNPGAATTRGMLVTILWRLEAEPAATKTISFTDVADGKWYAKAVDWAAAENIVIGDDGRFNPEAALTREQMAAILYRYAAYKSYDVSAADNLSAYADKPSDWALSSVKWAVAKGLIKGIGGGLDPKGSATRAQAATVLQRFIENTAK